MYCRAHTVQVEAVVDDDVKRLQGDTALQVEHAAVLQRQIVGKINEQHDNTTNTTTCTRRR